jgi:hypothetical protein
MVTKLRRRCGIAATSSIANFGRTGLGGHCGNVVQILNRNLFTVEINGQSILTFDAANMEMAEQFANSAQFQAHLMSHEAATGRLWDGRQPMRIREPRLNEIETWTAVFRANGEPGRRCLVWLFPVTDPKARRSLH